MKRMFDVMIAGIGLMMGSLVLALVALAIRMASGAPILFRQSRVGRDGRPFILWKFRTMTVMRSAAQGVRRKAQDGGSFDVGDSSRVTPLGRWLRQAKLDELPQLWNVLIGDMSLVGPRPEVRKWVDAYPERWGGVLTVRPGITDPASIVYRNEEAILARSPDPERTYREVILPHKLDLYEEYVRTQGFWRDIGILLTTLWVVMQPARRPETRGSKAK